jgi:hypothetical protein
MLILPSMAYSTENAATVTAAFVAEFSPVINHLSYKAAQTGCWIAQAIQLGRSLKSKASAEMSGRAWVYGLTVQAIRASLCMDFDAWARAPENHALRLLQNPEHRSGTQGCSFKILWAVDIAKACNRKNKPPKARGSGGCQNQSVLERTA